MDDSVPSLSSAGVGSRFVSQAALDSAKAKRDEQWKSAYERLGQEPPSLPTEDVYDGRSLAEKLAANRAAKQEEWEEKTKLANQFRALEDDEVKFLDSMLNQQQEQERKRRQEEAEDVEIFKHAVAERQTLSEKPDLAALTLSQSKTPSTAANSSTTAKITTNASGKKPNRANALKGVIVKKKPAQLKAAQTQNSASQGPAKRQKFTN